MSIGKCVQLCFSLYVCSLQWTEFFYLSICLKTSELCASHRSDWRDAFTFFCLTFDWSKCKFSRTQWYRTCNAFQRSLKYSDPFFRYAFIKSARAPRNKFERMHR